MEIDQANRSLGRIRSMPYGVARTEAAEAAARTMEGEGPQEALAYALFVLVESYVWGGEEAKAYVPFRRSMRLWDTNPELFDSTDRENFFWSFKWMVGGLKDYPEISRTQIEATLADMERRYQVAGNGLDAVAFSAFTWAWHQGDPHTDAAFDAWVRTPRDEFSQCEACELGDQAEYHVSLGRLEEAVRIVENVPETTRWCATEPADMLSTAALAYLDLGRTADAVNAHRRAVAALATSESDMSSARGRRILLLARGGHPDRALRCLREDAALLTTSDSPLSRLRFLRLVGAGLSAIAPTHGDQRIALAGVVPGENEPSVRQVHDWVQAQALELARAFDERNGTDRHVTAVLEAFATTPSAHTLDLAVVDVAALASGGSGSRGEAGADRDDGRDAGSGTPVVVGSGLEDAVEGAGGQARSGSQESALERAEREQSQGEVAEAAASYVEAARGFEETGALQDAGFAMAEAAMCAQELGDVDGAHAAFGAALARLRAADTPAEHLTPVLSAWAPVAAELGATDVVLDHIDAIVAQVEAVVDQDDLSEALAERRVNERRHVVASLDDAAARLIATAPQDGPERSIDAAIARGMKAAETYGSLGDFSNAAFGFWLVGELSSEAGKVDEAIWALESAVEGFGLARNRDKRAEVGGRLVGLLRESGQDARADEVVASLAS